MGVYFFEIFEFDYGKSLKTITLISLYNDIATAIPSKLCRHTHSNATQSESQSNNNEHLTKTDTIQYTYSPSSVGWSLA